MADLDLDRIYDDHASSLFAFLLSLTRNETDTRDLLQEVFQKLATHPSLLSEVRNLRAFLLCLSHNLAVDWMRRRTTRLKTANRLQDEPPDLFAPTEDPDTQAFRRALSGALTTLPSSQRAVVYLRLWEDLTFDAIAEILGIPLNTAASRYRYGLDKLRAHLRPLYDEIQ